MKKKAKKYYYALHNSPYFKGIVFYKKVNRVSLFLRTETGTLINKGFPFFFDLFLHRFYMFLHKFLHNFFT